MKEMVFLLIYSVDWLYNDVYKFIYFLLLNIWMWWIISVFFFELEYCFKNDVCYSEYIESYDFFNILFLYLDESKIYYFYFWVENK